MKEEKEETIAVQEVYKFMSDRHIIMSFLGDFTHEVVTSLLASIKKILSSSEMDFQLKKRFYAIVVECMDNISRHNVALEENPLPVKYNSTIFAISEHEDSFKIQTGNYILNSQMESLTKRLESVNSLDKDGLKALYREKIMEFKPEGGGLGLIDISIRSGCKLSYDFKPVSDDISFFILQTIVSK